MKKILNSKWFTLGTYILLVAAVLLVGFVFLQNNKTLRNVITSFFEVAENRTFDYRQAIKISHNPPLPNKDILVLAIDDASLEYLWDKYGEWPIPRQVYSNVINYIEKDNPQAIIFDLLFIKSIRSARNSDEALINALNKYENTYVGMNFDNLPSDVRLPADLPSRMDVQLDNAESLKIGKKYNFINCRTILPGLMNGTVRIGATNVIRSSDGIIRRVAPVVQYKGKYYPYLAFKAGSEYLAAADIKSYEVDSYKNLKLQDIKIPLNKYGEAVLNWYGISGTHASYPMYKLINDMHGVANDNKINFKDKIVIIGTTATSLHDTKSVPVQEGVYPGVEVHATFFNNILDNNFIRQTEFFVNLLILVGVIGLTALIVMYSTSTIFAGLSTILFIMAYLFTSYYVMEIFNLWIPVVIPTIAIIITFALIFIAKYLIKSRDFEYQYKLATVDGLTELYNHRYFQDTLRSQLEIAKRYEQPLSLIIIDIDFFKNFNDTYGHQSGDAVLRQVAQTLKKNSRTTDFVCRYGGEEMSIILPNTNAEEALFNAQRINKAIAEKDFQISANDTGKVTISLGVSTFPDNGQTPQELIEYADKCLYYAKEHGRNQVGIPQNEQNKQSEQNKSVEQNEEPKE